MLLVHVAGVADLGIEHPTVSDGESGAQAHLGTRDARWKQLVSRRLEELARVTTGREARRALVELTFGCAEQEAREGVVANASGEMARGPLDKEIQGLRHRLDGTWGDSEAGVDVLVIGVDGHDDPTADLARAIVSALRLMCGQGGMLEEVLGRTVTVRDACILPSLISHGDALRILEAEIGGDEGRVILPLAGGATGVLVDAAGVAAVTRPRQWFLMLIDRAGGAEAEATPIIDLSLGADPLKGWLMGLGLPTVLDAVRPGHDDADVAAAVEAVRRAMGEPGGRVSHDGRCPEDSAPGGRGYEGSTGTEDGSRAEDLAQVVLADVARGDIGAGMALRAWIVAEYRRRRRLYRDAMGLADSAVRDMTRCERSLGTCIRRLREQRAHGPLLDHDQWLSEQGELNDLGACATHELESSRSRRSRDVASAVREAVGQPPPWLSWPAPEVCFLAGQGRYSEGRQRSPMVMNLLSEPPEDLLVRACGVRGPVNMSVFMACSKDSIGDGNELRTCLKTTFTPHDRWRLRDGGIEVMDYGQSATTSRSDATTVANAMDGIRARAEAWLDAHSPRPRAVVVAVTGEKAVVISLLVAAQRFGARRGVPVFLTSSVRDGAGREQFQFHQFGLERSVRNSLLEAARYCMERFDLLSVGRLLRLGDPSMEEHAAAAEELADELAAVVQAEDLDAHAETVLDVFRVVVRLFDEEIPHDARIRLATIVGELISLTRTQRCSKAFREPIILTSYPSGAGRPSACNSEDRTVDRDSSALAVESAQLLARLRRIRNQTPVTHGWKSLEETTREVLKNHLQGRSWTYPQLLGRAIEEVAEHLSRAQDPPAPPSTWESRFLTLETAIERLRESAHANPAGGPQ